MKKLLIGVLAMFATAAFAGEYMDVTVGSTKAKASDQRSDVGVVSYGQTMGALTLEGRVGAARTANTDVNSNFAELRGRMGFGPMLGLQPWVRGTVGEQFNNGSKFGYWAVEPGLGFNVTPKFRVDGSVRRTEAFDDSFKVVNSTAYVASGSYALDKKNAFTLYLTKTPVGLKANMVEVGYTRSF